MNTRLLLNGLCLLIWLTSCKPSDQATQPALTTAVMLISSPAFLQADPIPKQYSCDGENISPPLTWTSIPEGTQSLVLIVDDPDAPVGTWVHWIVYDLPPNLYSLKEGETPPGTQGKTSFQSLGYGGPCPPKGSEHRYFFKIYAMDKQLDLEEGATMSEVEKAMKGHILAEGELMGKYSR